MVRTATLLLYLSVSTSAVLAQPGTPDISFAGDGFLFLQPGPNHDNGNAVAALPDTSAIVCGVTSIGFSFSAYLTRVLPNGVHDIGFGTNAGYTHVDLGEGTFFYDIAMADDGAIFTCGLTQIAVASPSLILLAKFTADGTLDPTFGTNGIVTTTVDPAQDAEGHALVLQSDGKIVVVGRIGFGGIANGVVLRFSADGSLDGSFSDDGVALHGPYPDDEDGYYGVDLLNDGSIIAGGYAHLNFVDKTVVSKLTSSGTFDGSFGGDGTIQLNLSPNGDQAQTVVASDDRFYLCGTATPVQSNSNMYVAQFEANGTPVSGFGTAGVATIDINANDQCSDMVLDSDGQAILCGLSGPAGFGSQKSYTVARFLADGTVDAEFGTNGYTATALGTLTSNALGLDLAVDGKIITAGVKADANNDIVVARYMGADVAQGTGNQSASMLPSLALFPNPAQDRLVVKDGDPGATFRIIDAAGRSMELQRAPDGTVDISALAPGLYSLGVSGMRPSTFLKQ